MALKEPPAYVEGHNLLTGKSVLITAAAGAGIGFAAATRAVEEGCRGLTISDAHAGRLNKAVAQLRDNHPDIPVFGQLCDVANESDVQLLIKKAEEQHSGIDVLINNAGLGGTCKLVEMPDEQWSRILDITLTGTMRMMRAILPLMQVRKSGVIINNASVLGWRAQQGQTHYAAAKAGVMALTRCAAMEAADYKVRINAVSPSIAFHEFLKKTTPMELLEELAGKEAFGRAAEVWEVANVMMFLASDYSSYMTGEIVSVSSQRA